MTDIKSRSQGINAQVEPMDVKNLAGITGNVYEALSIIAKRANQINVDLKEELQAKLEEFAVATETIEEVQENKEQIEISKFYERLPNPALLATDEFLKDALSFRYKGDEVEDADEKED